MSTYFFLRYRNTYGLNLYSFAYLRQYRSFFRTLPISHCCFLIESLCSIFQEEPPLDLVTTIKIPSTNSIPFHNIETMSNSRVDEKLVKVPKFHVDEVPFAMQLDDIKSLFLQVCSSFYTLLYFCQYSSSFDFNTL